MSFKVQSLAFRTGHITPACCSQCQLASLTWRAVLRAVGTFQRSQELMVLHGVVACAYNDRTYAEAVDFQTCQLSGEMARASLLSNRQTGRQVIDF